MAWKKAPPELVSAFDALVTAYPQAERRSMFGYPAVFLNGNMVAGLHEDRLVMRLDDDTAAEAKRRGASDFEPMAGRPMKGWVAVPEPVVAEGRLVRGWIAQAFHHVATMPAKRVRTAKKPTPAKSTRRARSRS
jgi:TfoX/Sxy family transcriptional regulator of competence genes